MLKLEHGKVIYQVISVNQGLLLSSTKAIPLVIELGRDFVVLNIYRKFGEGWSKDFLKIKNPNC